MRRVLAIVFVFVLLVTVLSTAAGAQSTEMESEPQFAVEAAYAAVTAGDMDAALELLTDDAVLMIVSPQLAAATHVGKEEIRAWFEVLHADGFSAEFSDVVVDGGRVTFRADTYGGLFESMELAPGEFEGVAIVQNGKVRSMTWALTEEFEARMLARQEEMADQRAGSPHPPGDMVRRQSRSGRRARCRRLRQPYLACR